MAKRGKTQRAKRTPATDRTVVANLLYQYVMLTADEQREFNRKLRVLRENSGMLNDLASHWRAAAPTTLDM